MVSGKAIRSTSIGSSTIASPFNADITTMVSSNAINVIGPMRGRKTVSYQSRPLALTSTVRVRKPAANGNRGRSGAKNYAYTEKNRTWKIELDDGLDP